VTTTVTMELELDGTEEAAEGTAGLTENMAALEAQLGESSQKVDALAGSLRRTSTQQATTTRATNAQSTAITGLGRSAGQAGSALGQMGSVLGQISPEFGELGSVVGRVGGAMSGLTAGMGPLGVALGVVTAAVGIGTVAWDLYQRSQEAARRQAEETARAFEESMEAGVRSAIAQQRAQVNILRTGASDEQFVAASRELRAMEASLEAMQAPARETAALQAQQAEHARAAAASADAYTVHQREQAAIIAEQNALLEDQERGTERRTGPSAAALDAQREELRMLADWNQMWFQREQATRRAAAAAPAFHQRNLASFQTALDAMDIARREAEDGEAREAIEGLQRQIESEASSLEAYRAYVGARTNATQEETARFAQELMTREAALTAHQTALTEIQASGDRATSQSTAFRVEQNELANEAILENTLASERTARSQRQELAEISVAMVEDGTKAIAKTFVAIAKGEKSADEAFRGLLASFLEFIGEMAGLQAAKEYALAIGDFASMNYSGGALHLAAGVAWTVVAVAAGAGAAAVAPAAASAPSSPEPQTAGGGGGGGGTTIVNFNQAVLTAGTHAEVGRVVSDAIDAKQRRFG
jgi:hypothetical protein